MAAALLLGCAISFIGHWRAWHSVTQSGFIAALATASNVEQQANQQKAEYETSLTTLKDTNTTGEGLVGNVDGRLVWLEMLKTLNQCLPPYPPDKPRPEEIAEREELHITELNCERFADVRTWYTQAIQDRIKAQHAPLIAAAAPAAPAPGAAPAAEGAAAPADGAAPPADGAAPPADGAAPPAGAAPAADAAAAPDASAATPEAAPDPGPEGAGWIVQLRGYHYHNKDVDKAAPGYVSGSGFVRDTLMKQLRDGKVQLPGKDGKLQEVSVKDLGIGYPVIVSEIRPPVPVTLETGEEEVSTETGRQTVKQTKTITLKRFDFILQFAWRPTPLSKRIEIEEQRAKEKQAGGTLAAGGGASEGN
jgi:hypothetical protein